MKLNFIAMLFCIVLGLSCSRKIKPVAEAPSSPTPQQTYRDLQLGERLQVVTPLRRNANGGSWEYGMSKTTEQMLEANAQPGGPPAQINLTITIDPTVQFGFERSNYTVRENGFVWIDSVVNYLGEETPAQQPVLRLLPPAVGEKRLFRILFITRVSDRDYNTALLGVADLSWLNRLTQEIRANPDSACRSIAESICVWVPPGVALNATR